MFNQVKTKMRQIFFFFFFRADNDFYVFKNPEKNKVWKFKADDIYIKSFIIL